MPSPTPGPAFAAVASPLFHLPARVLDGLAVCVQLSSGAQQDMGHIAQTQRIPARRLELAISVLLRAGILTSRRGRLGGYRLARSPESLPLLELIDALRNGRGLEDEWIAPRSVAVQQLCAKLESKLREILQGVTLAHLAKGALA